ncbi:MAG: histidinol phosphate phosphatase domain-containing protein [Acidobacteria bacterium]|nr:histidinol phosphate phosphatase domain-containing protein [Acidobacteriota bacterium]
MINLHAHSLLSDGVLLPTELFRRAAAAGFSAFAITDHVDTVNVEHVVGELTRVCGDLREDIGLVPLPGVEITHVPPRLIQGVLARARALGARVVLVHGESIVEPVVRGTNRAAIEGGADILVHPGLIEEDDVRLAAERGVYLEISTRRGHCYTNGHVAALARKHGARLILNLDLHSPEDFLNEEGLRRVARGAGLSPEEVEQVFRNAEAFVQRVR